jgi:YD repeat-containing protein
MKPNPAIECDYWNYYNADGNVESITAVNAFTGNQTTQYVYGTSLSDSGIASSLLKRAEIYPDSDDTYSIGEDGAPVFSDGADETYDRIEFRYNRQGEVTEIKDQNETVHAFDYDALGRQTQDRVTTLGTGVDGAVRRIASTFEVRGMREKITSYDNATVGSGSVVNEVEFAYNEFGQITHDYQAQRPTEEVSLSLAQRLIRFVLLALVITTIIAALIAALFCVLNVCATIGSGLPVERLARLPLAVVQFFALSWCCCALVTFPVSLHWCLFGQTRKIWVEGKQLRTQIGDRQATLDLEECTWSVWRGPYLGPARPRLSVTQNNRTVELGFTEEAAARWTAYFEAIGVYRTPSVHWPRFLLAIMIAGVVGGTVGCLLEPLMPLIGGPANPQGRLMFLGVLDGVMVILYRLAIRNGQFGRMGRLSGTWVMMVLLGGFAFKMFGTVWEIVGINSAVGAMLGWSLFPRGGRKRGQDRKKTLRTENRTGAF